MMVIIEKNIFTEEKENFYIEISFIISFYFYDTTLCNFNYV